jgi:hypothetical protein
MMTRTVWHLQPDGSYAGIWFDYSGPSHIPPELKRRPILTMAGVLKRLSPPLSMAARVVDPENSRDFLRLSI